MDNPNRNYMNAEKALPFCTIIFLLIFGQNFFAQVYPESIGIAIDSLPVKQHKTTIDPIHLANLNLLIAPLLGRIKASLLINNLFDNEIKYLGGRIHKQTAIIQPAPNYLLTITPSF